MAITGLIGEGFEQLDLRRREGTHLGATCEHILQRIPLADEAERTSRCETQHRHPTLENRPASARREREVCRARESSETAAALILISTRRIGTEPK